jgi:hypothetical protein
MRWAGHVAIMREGRGAYMVFVEKRGGGGGVGKSHRCDDDIKLGVKEK